MSTTYKLIGSRYLRKYTADHKTAVYNAAADAARIVSELCRVPWTAVDPANAELPAHGDDANAGNRDLFDAALFCCEHADGLHRAYANVAVYRYAVPTPAQGKTLESLSAKVTCDPYNAAGARLHVFTNDTGEIPMDCHELRGEGSDGAVAEDGTTAAGVAPRTVKAVDGKDYWYPTTATATLAPTGGLALGRFLFLVVALESYATTRGNWLEGAALVENRVSVTLAEAVDGWTAGGSEDLRGGLAAVALEGGKQPTWLQPLAVRAAKTLEKRPAFVLAVKTVKTDASWPINAPEYVTKYTSIFLEFLIRVTYDDESSTATVASYCSICLASPSDGPVFFEYGVKPSTLSTYAKSGTVPTGYTAWTVGSFSAFGKPVTIGGVEYAATDALTMLSASGRCVKSYSGTDYTSGGISCTLAIAFRESAENELVLDRIKGNEVGTSSHISCEPYVDETISLGKITPLDASSLVRTGTPLDECLADLSWQIATVDATTGARSAADTFAALTARLGEAAGRVAQDYAPAGGTFPHADLDCVTVVPRFERAATTTAGYDDLPQPGISLWFSRSESAFSKKARVGTKVVGKVVNCAVSPSFLQGAYLAVRANSAGSRLVLTATAAVANTGLALKIAAWRSKGAAWYGAQGFYTAAALGRVPGFAGASVASFSAPKFESLEDDSAGEGATAGGYASLAAYGGVEVELLGTSAEITGALAEGDAVEIALSADVAEGDAIILAPVPVAFTGSGTATAAYFGRQSAPSATTAAKGWARSAADLGWFPKIEIY